MPALDSSEHNRERPGLLDHILAEGLILIVLVAWWSYSRVVPEYIFPSPLTVGKSLLGFVYNTQMMLHVVVTMARVVAAVIIAAVIGGGLALMAFYWPITRDIVHSRIKPFLLSFPSMGWALLALVWFNISSASVVFVEVAVLTPFCLVNVSEGLRDMDRETMEMARSFTRRKPKTFFTIVWPMLYPFVIAAMRMAYGVGLKIALVAEVFGASSGLGYLMYQGEQSADTPLVFATCVAIIALYVAGDQLIFDRLSRFYRGRTIDPVQATLTSRQP